MGLEKKYIRIPLGDEFLLFRGQAQSSICRSNRYLEEAQLGDYYVAGGLFYLNGMWNLGNCVARRSPKKKKKKRKQKKQRTKTKKNNNQPTQKRGNQGHRQNIPMFSGWDSFS